MVLVKGLLSSPFFFCRVFVILSHPKVTLGENLYDKE